MLGYAFRRILRMIPLALAVVTLVFLMLRMIPGDPARIALDPSATDAQVAAMRHTLGLDRPVLVQYGNFLGKLLQGDMGKSFKTGRSVLPDAISPFEFTLELSLASLAVAVVSGVGLGVIAGARPYSWVSSLIMVLALLGVSVPTFWLGLLLMLLFSLTLDWLPVAGVGGLVHLILPTITLAVFSLGVIARITRASVAEVLHLDYVRTARAKGLPESKVVLKHAFKNALIPVITITGLRFGYMLGGAVATEIVFDWPGLGQFLIGAILNRDYPAVQAGLLLFSVSFLVVNLIVDLAYALVDPRISFQ